MIKRADFDTLVGDSSPVRATIYSLGLSTRDVS